MATSSFPCPFFAGPPPFPSTFTTAATYHHLSPHGFSPAHTPDSYFSPPPFGFGATASGFFPAPAYDPSILPFSTTYKPDSRSHPFTPSDQISPTPPPPSAHPLSPPSSLLLHRTNLCSPTPQLLDTIPTPTTHADLPYSKADEATKNSPSPPSATAEIRDDFAHHDPTVGHRRSTRSQNRIATAAEEAALLEAAHAQAMEEEAISARLPREILNIQRRLKQQQSSVDLLQGNISKLTDMVSQISLAVVRRPDSSEQEPMVTNQNSSPFSTPTPHATQLSPIMEGTTPNPTPTSQLRPSQSTPQQQQAIHFGNLAPTRFPHPEFPPQTLPPTPTASAPLMFCAAASSSASSPSDASTAAYVAPQEFGEMPQRYGLQSLSRQSIFLSDDSEHSYYARPEKYNLEQATSEPVFDVYAGEKDGSSTDFVDVLASLQEQHTHEDQQTYGSIEYNHSNNEIELPSVTNSELCTELGKAQVHNHECNMLLTEKREEGDPGIRKTLMDISQVAKLSSFTLVSSPLSMLWDPGAVAVLVTPLNLASVAAQVAHLTPVLCPKVDITAGSEMMLVHNLHNKKATQKVQQPRDPQWDGLVIHEARKAWDPGVHTIPGEFQFDVSKCCVPQQCDCRVPSRLINHGFLWDPGICNPMDLMPEETAVANPVHTMPTPFTLLKTVVQPIELNQFGAHLFLQCHSGCTTPNGFLQVQYCCLPTVLDCLYSEPDKQVVSYSSMFSSAATCMSTATTMCMRLALSSGKLTQAGKNAAALHQVLKMQLQMTNPSRIWDPGVRKFLCSWLTILSGWSATDKQSPCTSITDVAAEPNHSLCSALLLQLLFTQEKINWHEDIKCYGVALWIINFHPP